MSSAAVQDVGQVHLGVRDLPRAVAFYRDVLGLRFLFEVPGMAFFDAGNLRLMLGAGEEPPRASILYYRVADIRASFAALREAGVAVEGEPHRVARMPDHELWLAFLRDSEDNVFALMSEVRA